MGDCDSMTLQELEWAHENGIPIQRFPIEKDATDMQLALDIAIQRKKIKIAILGGIGGRMDHTLANLFLLLYAHHKGAEVKLIDPWHEISLLVAHRKQRIPTKKKESVSIVPIT